MSKIIVLTLICASILASCKTVVPTEVPIHYKERIVERLVPVKLPGDSLSVRALFECDSLNNVVMKQLSEQKSKGVESRFDFDGRSLNYTAKTVHDTVYISAKDSFIYQEVPVRVVVPVEVNKLTRWQKIQIKAGKAMFWLVGAGGIYLLVLKKSIVFPSLVKLLKWLKSLF